MASIKFCDRKVLNDIQHKIDNKTKPQGALGGLEEIALRVALIQQTDSLQLSKPCMVVFAADHGIAREGVSAFSQEVTVQMVQNFLHGGAAINVFCKQHDIKLHIVDAGVNADLSDHPGLIHKSVGKGTKSFLSGKAMSFEQCGRALKAGEEVVLEVAATGSNIIGFGEMGIGNTSSASMITSLLCGLPLKDCVGKGTGLDESQWHKKLEVLQRALDFHRLPAQSDGIEVLTTFGGFEIAMMSGAMMNAAELGMVVLVDGFIATSAFLVAHALQPAILDYAIFCHVSEEPGHQKALEFLGVKPVLQLNMRLGEGTGVAVAYPVIQSSINFFNEMASFEEAGVSGRDEVNRV
ncbi:nicotinate-nucleotide--dimethylbenzimidazole phosphoribosyltransferase [Fulvivirga sp. 29W222]|uniref:Nicotinate-nucleotide--dimethylbenzimidazole phosphoribosyltransferase n=1 Tax=Fulvivirga marina TaxID=2494733 RepID=A0A937FXW7_9BACT|nr:nicotinate-nucleotide--dimethylbenzimidazole phosphoribosyltransferase [Fulvivirga marina]MBL6447022.1 nicotinate-nucleotide--dimethylbenzimidazole phosphoribosyltransferase [Fulvivirga marina]